MSAVIDHPYDEIRAMRSDDIDSVLRIETEMYAFPWTKQIFKDCIRVGYDCRVCLDQGEIVAYVIMSSGAGEAHLLNLCVRSNRQRRGFAQSLLQDILHIAVSKKVETLFLEVRPSNHAARKLYEKFGFNEVGKRKDYYPAGGGREDAVILALTLI